MEFFPRIVPLRETRRGFLDDHDVQRQEQTLGINVLFYGRKGLQHEHASALRIPQRDHVYTLGRWDWTCSRWRKN